MCSTRTNKTVASGVALVTGGSRGLGRSAARHLAEAGWDVVVTYQARGDLAETIVAEVKALGQSAAAIQLDTGISSTFTDFAAVFKSVLERDFGRTSFDALVNNAGNSSNVSFAETTEQQFDQLMNVHLKGVFFLTQALLPLMSDGSRILNVSSGLARFVSPGKAAYAMMKGGVEVLTRYLAKELGSRGICVNTLAPGPIATDFSGGVVRDNPQVNGFIATSTALGRVGQPDDIGGIVVALLSQESGWVNGERIEASGGIFL